MNKSIYAALALAVYAGGGWITYHYLSAINELAGILLIGIGLAAYVLAAPLALAKWRRNMNRFFVLLITALALPTQSALAQEADTAVDIRYITISSQDRSLLRINLLTKWRGDLGLPQGEYTNLHPQPLPSYYPPLVRAWLGLEGVWKVVVWPRAVHICLIPGSPHITEVLAPRVLALLKEDMEARLGRPVYLTAHSASVGTRNCPMPTTRGASLHGERRAFCLPKKLIFAIIIKTNHLQGGRNVSVGS